MQLGVIGLGRMGGNIVRRRKRAGHDCVIYDRNAEEMTKLAAEASAAASKGLEDLVARLEPPRAVWVMLPAGEATEQTVANLGRLLQKGDTIIDGGNSFWQD